MRHCSLIPHVSSPILWLFGVIFTGAMRSNLVSLLSEVSILSGCRHYIAFDLHRTLLLGLRNIVHVERRRVMVIRVGGLLASELIKVTFRAAVQVFKSVEISWSWRRKPRCFLQGSLSTNLFLLRFSSLLLRNVVRCRDNGFIFLLHRVLLRRRVGSFFAFGGLIVGSWLVVLTTAIVVLICVSTTLNGKDKIKLS